MQQYQNKPSVYIDLHFYWGELIASNMSERASEKDLLVNRFDAILKQADLFEYYTFNQHNRKPNDYTIKVNVYNHGSYIGVLPAIITSAIFYIIPSYVTDNYVLTWQVVSPNNQQIIMEKQNEDYIRTWQGIWFLPLSSNTPHNAIANTFDRQVKSMLKQIIDKQVAIYDATMPF